MTADAIVAAVVLVVVVVAVVYVVVVVAADVCVVVIVVAVVMVVFFWPSDTATLQTLVSSAHRTCTTKIVMPHPLRGTSWGSNALVRSMNVSEPRRRLVSKLISTRAPCSRRGLPHACQRSSACVRQ